MGKIIGIIAVVAVVIIGGFYLLGGESSIGDNDPNTGAVVLSVTDEAVNMENVSEVNLEISDIQMHRADGEGWETVSNEDKSYSLLELNQTGEVKLYASANLPIGEYDQVRVKMKSVNVVSADGETSEATMVEDNFEVDGMAQVSADSTTAIKLDFIASDSLYTSQDGRYVFAPVVNMETRANAEVSTDENTQVVTTTGGTVTADTTVGLDVDGQTKTNFTLGNNTQIRILEDGSIQAVRINGPSSESQGSAESQTDASAEVEASAEETREAVEETVSDLEAEVEANANLQS